MVNLVDAPSMPITSMEVEESQDEEVEFSMGKLIRQASLSNLDALPPRTHVAKGITATSRLSRHGSIRKEELSQLEGQHKIRPQRLMSKLKTQKSLNDLQSRELQASPLLRRQFPHPLTPSIAIFSFYQFPVKTHQSVFALLCPKTWITQLSEELTTTAITDSPPPAEEGPVELSSSISPIFATSDDPSPLQTATSVLLTGAITVLLFRSLRRRAKRAKETRLRSSGEKKSLTEEAVESLKSVTLSPVSGKSPPSPVQAFLGAVTAGVISLILYKFTTTIEASLNRQTIPDNYSVRQITITIRTIINGLCYLATFVFGVNSFGLFLYSGQLAFNSFMEGSSSENDASSSSSDSKSGDLDGSGITSASEDQNSDNTQMEK
ncbi:hypothetical protein DH2020_031717 [Rehmannia glutinosa]|uniref:Transmembrane protein n=1 Tax=Rehmannia glutinosa TaxID=99300 RepID=A0ABR0VKK3_REHGL